MTAHEFPHDEDERRRWQNAEAILRSISLSLGSTFVDMGCGDGFFALPAARLVGKAGKVYAIDQNAEAIERLKKKAAREGLRNLETKVAEAEETLLCNGCADIVFFGIVLHDFRDPARVLTNAKAMLKASGRLVNLDWKKEPMELGPPLRIRLSEEEATQLLESVGLRIATVKEAGPYHYIMIAKPR